MSEDEISKLKQEIQELREELSHAKDCAISWFEEYERVLYEYKSKVPRSRKR